MQLTGRGLATSRAGQVFMFLIAGGAISVWRRKDVNWDLQNYHFYNPWAWFNDRLGSDLAPAQIQTYFSPLLDVPFFLLVWADVHPALIGFLMGIPAGIALVFFFWIARLACQTLSPRDGRAVTLLAFLLGLTGAAGMPTVGSTMNEWHTAALVMPAVFIALRLCAAPTPAIAARGWLLSGFLLGAASGLKLTAVPYGLGVVIAAISTHRLLSREQRGAVLGLIAGGIAGFLATYGYWAVVLTKQFANPVFPFFNALFRSPDWFAVSFRDHFGPKTVLEGLLFPFELAKHGVVASNVAQRDPRLAALFLGLALIGLLAMMRKIRHATTAELLSRRSFVFLIVFTVSAYLVWLIQFSVYRYLIPVELIGSLLLVLCARLLLHALRWRLILMTALCLVIVAATDRPGWGRRSFGERYFNVVVPALPERSMVLLYGGEPLAYLLPFFGPTHRYVRPSSNFTHPSHSHGLQRKIERAIREHAAAIYAIRKPDQDPADEALVLRSYRLRLAEEPCLPIHSDIHPGLGLCRLVRVVN